MYTLAVCPSGKVSNHKTCSDVDHGRQGRTLLGSLAYRFVHELLVQRPRLRNRLLVRLERVDAVQALVEVQDGSGLTFPRPDVHLGRLPIGQGVKPQDVGPMLRVAVFHVRPGTRRRLARRLTQSYRPIGRAAP